MKGNDFWFKLSGSFIKLMVREIRIQLGLDWYVSIFTLIHCIAEEYAELCGCHCLHLTSLAYDFSHIEGIMLYTN